MKSKKFLFLTVLSIMMVMLLAACGGKDEDSSTSESSTEGDKNTSSSDIKFLSLVTGGTQGTYYALGGTFADLISNETGIKTTAEVSQASAANVNALKAGDAEIAFVQTDIAYYAKNGLLMFDGEPMDDLVAIGALYPETVQLVTTSKSGIKSFDDLKGKKVSVGAPGSGTYANAEQLLEVHGLTMNDIQPQNLDFGESVDGLQAGQIDAAFITAGYPTAAVEALSAQADVVIVPVDPEKAKALIEKYPYYKEDVIPAGTYGLAEDVPTVSVLAMLAVKKDLPEDVAYGIAKAIYENTDKIGHAKAEYIKKETALDGIGIDVHPGAKKYFEE
ncbi:TAXI family TRAP transporter solute-binding subunit [Ureibacillus thermophilus]|uniref:TAXI family TRAP transporter solute-binding subunit n=1 Tax=Ureibacillus thermophilus TaxID=367743 RepID=A0A4P6UQG0_9BACL|nr:TAXI family TRAP transporter solute-binding subunit [Ureibacillus thermophilus]QBK24675.1 TAXI family TRAP transporter solute-binding subunit [Ureibacillus thermophilus]